MEQFKEVDLDNLKPNYSLKWYQMLSVWNIENRFTYPLRLFVAQNDVLYGCIKKIRNYLTSRILDLRNHLHNHEQSIGRLSSADQMGYDLDSKYGYSGDVFAHEVKTALSYQNQIAKGFPNPSESKKLYEHIINLSNSVLETQEIPVYLNFSPQIFYYQIG